MTSRIRLREESCANLSAVCLLQDAQLHEGCMTSISVPGVEAIALYRVAGQVYATQDTCTHAQASLSEGELEGDQVWCPVHAASFCVRTGAALRFPAAEPLRTFRAWVEGGAIYADLTSARRQTDEGMR